MTGIEAGKTWSRIGPEVAPTSSAASGIWMLNEAAEYIGAGTWPVPQGAWEVISTTVADGTTATYNFTSIPQTYRDLRLVVSAARTAAFNEEFQVWVDIGSGLDTTSGNYGTRGVQNLNSSYGSMQTYSFQNKPSFDPEFPEIPDAGAANSNIWDFLDYANTAKLPGAIGWQQAIRPGSYNGHQVHGGWMYDSVGGVQAIRVNVATTTSNYFFKSPTTFTLFGRGTAD